MRAVEVALEVPDVHDEPVRVIGTCGGFVDAFFVVVGAALTGRDGLTVHPLVEGGHLFLGGEQLVEVFFGVAEGTGGWWDGAHQIASQALRMVNSEVASHQATKNPQTAAMIGCMMDMNAIVQ